MKIYQLAPLALAAIASEVHGFSPSSSTRQTISTRLHAGSSGGGDAYAAQMKTVMETGRVAAVVPDAPVVNGATMAAAAAPTVEEIAAAMLAFYSYSS